MLIMKTKQDCQKTIYNLKDTPEHVENENKNARKLYIIFLDIPEHVDDENKNASAKKAAAAAERRARIMKQIAAQQSHFMKVTGNVQLI